MRTERVVERALCIEGGVRIDDLRTGTLDDAARAAVGSSAVRLRDHPLSVIGLSTPVAPEAWDDMVPRVPAPALVVVDSLQALAVGRAPLDEELAAAVRALKSVALERDVAVLLPAHLPLLLVPPGGRRPTLGDFGVLGAAGQHADAVLALFREEMYGAAPGTAGATELLVLKNRNGPTGYVDLYFRAHCMRFEDMLDPER
jgi:replicative DNA helicase